MFGWLIPSLGVGLISWWLQDILFGLGSLVLWIVAPLIILGCPKWQSEFRQYLKHSAKAPHYANSAFNEQLRGSFSECVEPSLPCQVQTDIFLCWLNFRYYFSIIFWFSVAGPTIALSYGLLRSLRSWSCQAQSGQCSTILIDWLLYAIDWLPSRANALCYILCRGSREGFSIWLESLKDIHHHNAYWLGRIAQACMGHDDAEQTSCTQHTIAIVVLLKNSIWIALVVIALISLYGY